MQSLKLLSNVISWYALNKKLEELTKSNQSKLAGDIFENVCKYFLQTTPQYQTKLKNCYVCLLHIKFLHLSLGQNK